MLQRPPCMRVCVEPRQRDSLFFILAFRPPCSVSMLRLGKGSIDTRWYCGRVTNPKQRCWSIVRVPVEEGQWAGIGVNPP